MSETTIGGNFHVYKSSAGSGKTHTLTMIYLGIILKRPSNFRHILAITFTNKAANEIKQRIVDTLSWLACTNLEAVTGYDRQKVEQLLKLTGLQNATLQENAQKALGLILHHYHDFAVSTIDSFVHRIIRTFAFDLKLMSNFEVEMETDMLLSLTVDKVLADAGRDKDLTDVLVNYIENQADNDESWQIDTLLTNFAKNLFNEQALSFIQQVSISSAQQIKEVQDKMMAFIRNFYIKLESYGNQAITLINKNNISPEVFYRKHTGIYGYFHDPVSRVEKGGTNKYILETVENDKWTTSANQATADATALMRIKNELLSIYQNMQRLTAEQFPTVALYEMIRNSLYPMAVLNALAERLQIVLKERNVVPIAAFNKIISNIVMNEPVPFIYERTGEKFRHFLIDEFQDTSVMQWHNLLPLLENALATGHLCMIVGDGKQAIYRWRHGDADQFVDLPLVANPSGNATIEQRSAVLKREFMGDKLDKNWRSRNEIVDFNNRFFAFASKWFLAEKSHYYDEVHQTADPLKTGGLIRIQIYAGAPEDYEESMCKQVLDCVMENINAGYQPGDICILARTNKSGQIIASHLTEAAIKVVSTDSLLLSKAAEVQFLISWFRLLLNRNDSLSAAHIVEYLYSRGYFGETASRQLLLKQTLDSETFNELLRTHGFEVNYAALEAQSLYDQAATLVRKFKLNETAPVYIQFFLDEVLNVSSRNEQGMSGFLEYWELKKSQLSVTLPASADAVQVMTIHKAKGLEFPVVIAAFVDYSVQLSRDYSWVALDEDPVMPDVKVAMFKMTQKVLSTSFASLYEEEKSKAHLDLLNMLYVTLTRPSERLFVFTGPLASKDSKSEIKTMPGLFAAFFEDNKQDPRANPIMELGEGSYIRGRDWSQSETLIPDFTSNAWQHRLVIASRAPGYWLANAPESFQTEGLIMHEALKTISVPADVKPTISRMTAEGLIAMEQVENIEKQLNNLMDHPEAGLFFKAGLQSLNEAEILSGQGKSFRPDRVVFHTDRTDVIDYKTGQPRQSNHEQVQHYANLLSAMGYPRVSAWLIYLGDDIKVTAA